MDKDLEKAQDILLEKISKLCREFGLNNVMAQLYAILYFSNKPLSLNEMVERLRISKGSISINIRALERYGAAKRVWVKGSRKDYYEAEPDVSKVVLDRIKSMAGRRLAGMKDTINAVYNTLNQTDFSSKEEKNAIDAFKQRLGKLKDLHAKAESLFNLFNSGLVSNALNSKLIRGKKESTYATSLD